MNKEFEEWYRKEYGTDENEMSLGNERISYEAFSAGQQSERDKHRWIPVTERLPNENQRVLVKFYKYDFITIRKLVKFDKEYGWKDDNTNIPYIAPFSDFVAWQPLPEV